MITDTVARIDTGSLLQILLIFFGVCEVFSFYPLRGKFRGSNFVKIIVVPITLPYFLLFVITYYIVIHRYQGNFDWIIYFSLLAFPLYFLQTIGIYILWKRHYD